MELVSQRWNDTVGNMRRTRGHDVVVCTCCDKQLDGAVRMLELDQRHCVYHDFGGVPEDQSQGWFPFGLTCAKKMLAKAILKLNK